MLGGFVVAAPPVICKLFFQSAELPLFGKVMDCGPHFACLAMVVSFLLCLIVSVLTRRQPNPAFYGEESAAENALQNEPAGVQ